MILESGGRAVEVVVCGEDGCVGRSHGCCVGERKYFTNNFLRGNKLDHPSANILEASCSAITYLASTYSIRGFGVTSCNCLSD